MEIVKKNIVSIVCGVIALIAVIALFWPIKGYYEHLQATTNARKAVYTSLTALTKKSRQLPVVDPFTAETKPLDQFPTQAVIDRGNAVTEQVKNESAAILREAIRINQHELLVPGSLPAPMTTQAITFRDTYRARINFINETTRPNSFPVQIMQAGFPPTDLEIQNRRAEVEAQIKLKAPLNAQGQPIHPEQIEAELAQALSKISEQVKIEAAQNCKVYIDPTSFDPYAPIANAGPGLTPEASAIFMAQASLWVQEDVCKSIAAANSKAANVMESPVKHLIKVEISPTMFQPPPPAPGQPPAAPGPPDMTAALSKTYAATPTGRVSNSVYDVVPFSLRLDVDAEEIPLVLQEISRNNFTTVTNVSMQVVDPGLIQGSGYIYGSKPVVQLDLRCETLFLRQWTAPLIPVIKDLSTPAAKPGQPAQPSGPNPYGQGDTG